MNAAFPTARSAMTAAQRMLDSAASGIARAGLPPSSPSRDEAGGGAPASPLGQATSPGAGEHLAGAIVEQKVALYAFKLSANVLRTQDAVLGSLLDVRA